MEGKGEVESVLVAHMVVVPDPEEHWEPLRVPLRETVPEEHWEVLLDWVTLGVTEGLWEALLVWVTLPVWESVNAGLGVLMVLSVPDIEVVAHRVAEMETVALKLDFRLRVAREGVGAPLFETLRVGLKVGEE